MVLLHYSDMISNGHIYILQRIFLEQEMLIDNHRSIFQGNKVFQFVLEVFLIEYLTRFEAFLLRFQIFVPEQVKALFLHESYFYQNMINKSDYNARD